MEFRLLGEPQLWVEDEVVNLGSPKQQVLLVVLLLAGGQPVPVHTLVDHIWGDEPPEHCRNVLASYLSRLRRIFDRVAPGAVRVSHRSGAYALRCDPAAVDLFRFRRLTSDARVAAMSSHDERAALAMYDDALALWRGPALAGLRGSWITYTAAELDRERRSAQAARIDLLLRLGRPGDTVNDLHHLVGEHPRDEGFATQLMTALDRTGRTAEAIGVYHTLRQRLSDELGVDPSRHAQETYLRLLRMEPATAAPPTAAPAQLPADVFAFTGRAEHLRRLNDLLEPGSKARAIVITAVAGMAGVGKTALAVHWAYQVRDRFPDGQLYVNLRGFHPNRTVMDPAEAIRGFLHALDVSPQRVPVDLDAQTALYRSLLADRRVLVVLDNARDTSQVRPLLPGAPGCLVVVTSRNQLTGLVATEAAHPIAVDPLSPDEAAEMLARRLGHDRTATEPKAVQEIITSCARLPLALAIVAARAATQANLSLAALAADLRESHHRLDALTGDDSATDVRAVFSWSYDTLSPDAARLFRLLGLHPGPDISTPAVASLAGLAVPQVRSHLAELARTHLVDEHTAGRYSLHDLLRVYATEQSHAVDGDDQRNAATRRMLDHYLHTAHAAARLLDPHRDPIILNPPDPGAVAETLGDYGQALEWFATEHAVLLAAVDHASVLGWDTYSYHLAWTLADFLDRRGHWHDYATVQQIAIDAARRLADTDAEARAHRYLAHAYIQLGRFDEARRHLEQALDLYALCGDRTGQAHAHNNLAYVWGQQGRYSEALEHATQALVLCRATGHQAGQGAALNAVGWYHALLGDYQQAITYCQQALTLHQQLGDRGAQSFTLDSLGFAHHHLGHYDQALMCYQQALDLTQELGDRYQEATTLTHIGDAHSAAGNKNEARTAWYQALAIFDDLDHADAEQIRTRLATARLDIREMTNS